MGIIQKISAVNGWILALYGVFCVFFVLALLRYTLTLVLNISDKLEEKKRKESLNHDLSRQAEELNARHPDIRCLDERFAQGEDSQWPLSSEYAEVLKRLAEKSS